MVGRGDATNGGGSGGSAGVLARERDPPPVTFQCPMLTTSNYNSWAIKMESIMDAQGLWDAIIPPTEGAHVDPRIVKRARAFLFQALPEDVLLQVAEHRDAKKIWDALKTRYLGADRVQKARIQTLDREFELLKMHESDSIDSMAGKISELASKTKSLGSTIPEVKQVKKLLNSVPDRFLPIVASIEQFSDLETMPFEEAIGRLKAYEERTRPQESKNSSGQLLLTKSEWQERQKSASHSSGRGKSGPNRPRGRGSGRSGGRGRGRRDDKDEKSNVQEGKRDRRNIRCFNCDKIGHYSSECKAPRKPEEDLNLVKEDEEQPILLIAQCSDELVMLNKETVCIESNQDIPSQGCEWYLDNGASNHMSGQRDLFGEFDESISGNVKFGDGSAVEIKGRGSVVLQSKHGNHHVISNVYYIPDLCNNILSLGQLTEVGCKITMKEGVLSLYDQQGSLLLKVPRSSNRLYKTTLHIAPPVCLLSKIDEKAWIWHARLGHLNFQALSDMTKGNLVHGVPKIQHPNQICDACMAGKQRRLPFPQQASFRAKQPLELVHADLCGPFTPSTLAGNKYFLLLVDDYSRFMWVYVIEKKSQAFDYFQRFKKEVEQEVGLRIKTL